MLPLLAVSPAFASDLVPVQLGYSQVRLSNGRVLHHPVISSFNREAGLIYVMEDRQLRPYPVSLFPTFVTDAVERAAAEVPVPTRRLESVSAPPANAARPRGPGEPNPDEHTPLAIETRRLALLDAVAARAETAAINHFRYNTHNGSGYSTLTGAHVELEAPEAVPGWTNRYRVRGDAGYGFYDSVGGTFNRRRRGVEVLLEARTARDIRVLEVTTIWGAR